MWRQVALPVIVVGLSWLTVSGATTFYLHWLDASYQRAFDENVASMHASSMIQQAVWRLHAELVARWGGTFDWQARLVEFDRDLREPLQILVSRSSTPGEQEVSTEVRRLIERYRGEVVASMTSGVGLPVKSPEVHHDRLFQLAAQISDGADRIRQINDDLLRSSGARRDRISTVVLWTRGFTITLVPMLGIMLGWWTARRLQRTVARIQVTLHDPALSAPGHLGMVQVRGDDELSSIQQQVALVVNRLRSTGEELQAARQEVVRAERLAAIGGLAAGVAHELRNPLTSVKLLLQHAASRGGDAVVAAQRMGLILDEVERMEGTIQGLLDFSRPAQPQRKRHDLRETLQRAIHLVEGRAEKQNVTARLRLGETPVLVNGDPQQLHQVFVNLLINAIEAMPEGGELSMAVRSEREGSVTVEIRDTGDGIPSELLPRLFEPFASAKERGTGLGLAVSRRIIEEHGGSIAVRPHATQGTVFEVTLPAVPQREPALVGLM